MTHKHILTIEGEVPADEMERAAILAHPEVQKARAGLIEALTNAGAPHTATSKVIKAKTPAVKPAEPVTRRHAAE